MTGLLWYLVRPIPRAPCPRLVERVRFLSDTEATDYAIARAVSEASALAGVGGRVWFVFIGHGAPSTKGEGLLVAVDAHQSVEGLEHRSVPQSKVLAQLATSASTPKRRPTELHSCPRELRLRRPGAGRFAASAVYG